LRHLCYPAGWLKRAMKSAADLKLETELKSFNSVWQGGYFEGDPLDPLARSNYRELGYMSVLHVTYLMCIKPFVHEKTVALEIGPGRGAWTRCLLPAREVWCLDALSAEHNRFWEYVGRAPNVKYFQVNDFRCEMLPDNGIDYLFSFGCFCHVSFAGITEYMKSLRSKLRSGAHGFILVADYEKFNRTMDNFERFSILRPFPWPVRMLAAAYRRLKPHPFTRLPLDGDDRPSPGRWYNAGTERTCEMLEQLGYTVVEPDMQVNHRDPVIHFVKD
jgi:hypothetical protein